MFLRLSKQSQFITLQNVVYFITLIFVRKIFTFYINDVLLFKCPFPGPKVKFQKISQAFARYVSPIIASHIPRSFTYP